MNKQVPTLKKPTRIFSKRRTSKWWVWQYTPAWGTAFLFVVGSLFFLIGSSMRLFRVISDKRQATRVFVLTPYFLGSFCYTSGCALPLPRTFLQWRRSRQQPRRKARGRSDREVEKARIQNYLAKIDFIGAVMAVTGGLFINSATSVDLYLGSKAELYFTAEEEFLWKVTIPTMLGRAMFMLAGWFTWAARNQSWNLRIHHGTNHFWWTSVLFWLGAAGFYYGYFCSNCPFNLLPSILVSNWFCIVSGYILGSVCLLSASYIMILELAFMQCRTERETDASEVPLIVV